MTSVPSQAAERKLSSDMQYRTRIGADASLPRSRMLRNPQRVPSNIDQRRSAQGVHNVHMPDGEPATSEWVVARLEEAGATLLGLPHTGYSTRLRVGALHPVPSAEDMLHALPDRPRAPVPSAACVDRMDQALAWVPLIPEGRLVLRRIVHARALVSPLSGKHLFTWRRLAAEVNTDHKAVQRWHAQGISIIVTSLNGQSC